MCGFMNLNPQKVARTEGREWAAVWLPDGEKPLVEAIKAKVSGLVAAKVHILKEAKLL